MQGTQTVVRSVSRGALAVALAALGAPLGADALEVESSRVAEVTLYRGEARVVRSIEIEAPAGSHELAVPGLPRHVVPTSLFAEGGEGIAVRAVRHRSRAVGEAPEEEVRQLDARIRETEDKLALNERRVQLTEKQLSYLDGLDGFVPRAATAELAEGSLDPQAVTDITRFSFHERQEALEQQVELVREKRELEEELALLRKQRAEVAAGSQRMVQEALVFLEKDAPGRGTLRLAYLVGECGWSPSYNLRADGDSDRIRMEYNAVVSQMSGEDWSDVRLTLSTASPALSAAGPALAPFRVTLAGDGPVARQKESDVARELSSIRQRQQQAVASNAAAVSESGNIASSWSINDAAGDYQLLELTCSPRALETIRGEAPAGGEGPSLSYRLPGTVRLESRSDQQMLRILEAELDGSIYYVATPVLSSFVYREAEVVNTSGDDLLGGPVSVYLDGRFVGRTELSTVARGQTFVLGLGADPQLRARRELLERELDTQGGNTQLTARYRLAVESYKTSPVSVRLLDRIPYTDAGTDIRVTLGDLEEPLSDDPVYQRLERPRGILRWDLEVPAGASGETARVIEYGYEIEHDRSLRLTAPEEAGGPRYKQQFEELYRQRRKR